MKDAKLVQVKTTKGALELLKKGASTIEEWLPKSISTEQPKPEVKK